MSREKPSITSGADQRSALSQMTALIRDSSRAMASWACLIAVSVVCFWLTEGTRYHPLSIGILISSSILFVLMALFEGLWRRISSDKYR